MVPTHLVCVMTVNRRTSAVGEAFSNSFEMWPAIYVNWSVYFGAEEVKTELELPARAAAGSRSNLN